jgi:GDP-L-fucose synthase
MVVDKNTKIYVAGHNGMVGSSIVRNLRLMGYENIITRSRKELELTNQRAVTEFFDQERPVQIYMAAAKVGGIYANNTFPAEFIYENLMVECNLIHQAFLTGTKKILFLGSSCIYPRLAEQPMVEEALMEGKLEPTNEPYGVAKIAGIKLCESYNRQYGESHGVDYRSVMPTNLYGPGDNYHPENSHVIPALMRRLHEAKTASLPEVVIWGTGTPMREFLFVDDLALASIFVMNLPKEIFDSQTEPMRNHINVGYGSDLSIKDLALLMAKVVGFEGNIRFDATKPDGSPRKLMDSSRLRQLGWAPQKELEVGLQQTYKEFCSTATRSK